MDVRNTGAVELSGSAVIEVRNSAGVVLQRFEHAVTRLQPKTTLRFSDNWTTAGVVPGAYTVVGDLHYESTVASRSLSIRATGGARRHLPIVRRGS